MEWNAFSPLRILLVLSLEDNNLVDINVTWEGLSLLRELNCRSNKIEAISKYSLLPLKSLSELELGENKLLQKHFHHITLKNIPNNISYLSFSFNNFKSLTRPIFVELKYLKTLMLSFCQTEHVETGTFINQNYLQTLWMNHNRLVNITAGIWEGLVQLRELNLDGNSIEHLIGEAFQPLQSLLRLNLQRNHISHINVSSMRGLNKLILLNILDNNLFHLESGSFQDLPSVEVAHLEGNYLTHIERGTLDGLINCKTIFLLRNRISKISDGGLDAIRNVEFLDLRYNYLSHLQPGLFRALKKLQSLHLGANFITNLELGTFQGLMQCKSIYLQCNRISQLTDGVLNPLKNLEYFDIRNNTLHDLHSSVTKNDITKGNTSLYLVVFEELGKDKYGNFCLCQRNDVSLSGIYIVKIVKTSAYSYKTCSQVKESYLCCDIPVSQGWKILPLIGTRCGTHNYSHLATINGYVFHCKQHNDNFSLTSKQFPLDDSLTTTIPETTAEKPAELNISEYKQVSNQKTGKESVKPKNNKVTDSAQRYLVGMSFIGPGAIIILSLTSFATWRLNKNHNKERRRREMARESADIDCHDKIQESYGMERTGQPGTSPETIRGKARHKQYRDPTTRATICEKYTRDKY